MPRRRARGSSREQNVSKLLQLARALYSPTGGIRTIAFPITNPATSSTHDFLRVVTRNSDLAEGYHCRTCSALAAINQFGELLVSTPIDSPIGGEKADNHFTAGGDRPNLDSERQASAGATNRGSPLHDALPHGFEHRYVAKRDPLRDDRIADALGWLSIGLGLTALLAPRAVCRATGMRQHPTLLRAVGVRELASGAALLTQKHRFPWLWARVAGDAMDLALLSSAALRRVNPHRSRTIATLGVVASIAAADLAASLRQTKRRASRETPVRGSHEDLVEQSLLVNKSPEECYAFWRNLENLPRFIPMLESISAKDDRRSHWVVKAPLGPNLEWDSEITADHPGERIAWRSVGSTTLTHAGNIRFDPAPGGRGTMVRVSMHLEPALGRASVGVSKLLGKDPNFQTRENLRRFKSLIETGEVPTTCGQPSGRRSWFGRLIPEGRKSRQGDFTQARAS